METSNKLWTKVLKYNCDFCPLSFDDEQAVRAHLREDHGRKDV